MIYILKIEVYKFFKKWNKNFFLILLKYNYVKNIRIIKKLKNKVVLFLMDICMLSIL